MTFSESEVSRSSTLKFILFFIHIILISISSIYPHEYISFNISVSLNIILTFSTNCLNISEFFFSSASFATFFVNKARSLNSFIAGIFIFIGFLF